MWRMFVIIVVLVAAMAMDLAILFKGKEFNPTTKKYRSPFWYIGDWVYWGLIAQAIGGASGLIVGAILDNWSVLIALILLILSLSALYTADSKMIAGPLYLLFHKKEDPKK